MKKIILTLMIVLSVISLRAQNGCADWASNSQAPQNITTASFEVLFTFPASGNPVHVIVEEVATGITVFNDMFLGSNNTALINGLEACTDYVYYVVDCATTPTTLTGFTALPISTLCYDCNGATECAAPEISVDPDNSTGAEIFWLPIDCAIEYLLYYRPLGNSGWGVVDDLTSPYHYLGGLEPCSVYEVKVVAKCESNGIIDYSDFSAIELVETPGAYFITYESFETGWGIFNDGGSDCWRPNNATLSCSGNRSLGLRDNSGTSRSVTDILDICGADEIKLDFQFRFDNMQWNRGLVVDFYNGNSWQPVAYYRRNNNHLDDICYSKTLLIDAASFGGGAVFGSNHRLRFRTTGKRNEHKCFVDAVLISACSPVTCRLASDLDTTGEIDKEELIIRTDDAFNSSIKVYPNPATDRISIDLPIGEEVNAINLYDLNGTLIKQFSENQKLNNYDISELTDGMYLIQVITPEAMYSEKFLVKK